MDIQLLEVGIETAPAAPIPLSDEKGTAAETPAYRGISFHTFKLSRSQVQSLIAIFTKLGILDRLLTPAILICMILGVVIGEFAPHVQQSFNTARFDSVSVRK